MLNIGIVTDSLSNLPKEVAEKYNINIAYGSIFVDNTKYKTGVDITTEELLKVLETKNITTGVPSAGEYFNLYEKLLDQYDAIISIHAPAKITGFIKSAKTGAKRTRDPEKIFIIETGVATIALGLVAISTAILAEKMTDLDELVKKVQELADKVDLIGVLGSFKYLKRSGRVKMKVAGQVASILSIKPVINLKGADIKLLEKPRKLEIANQKLKEAFIERFDPNVEPKLVGLSRLNLEKEFNEMQSIIKTGYPEHSIIIADADPMVAANTGPELLLVAYFSK